MTGESRDAGTWPDAEAALDDLDPAFVDRFDALASHPVEDGSLDEATTALVALASHAACKTVYEPEIRRWVGRALDAGAGVDGVHAVTEGVPVLVDEASLPGDPSDEELEERERLREKFVEKRGYWDEMWDHVLQLDPVYFEAYLDLSAHPTETDVLPPPPPARARHRRRLREPPLPPRPPHPRPERPRLRDYGASREDVMAVLEIATTIGVNTVSGSLLILLEEAAERDLLED